MKTELFYRKLLDMKGEQFARRARKDILVARLVVVSAFVAGICASVFFTGTSQLILSGICFATIGAAATTITGVEKRLQVWPMFDQVINWTLVKEKAKEN